MLILSESDLRRVLKMRDLIDAVENGFQSLFQGSAFAPERLHLTIPSQNAVLLEMPALMNSQAQTLLGTKIVSVFPDNAKKNLDTVQGLYLLLDGETGKPLALMEGKFITAMRTAATSAVATKFMAGAGLKRLAIFGAGVQARFHIEAMLAVAAVERVLIASRSREKAERLAEFVEAVHHLPCDIVTLEEAAASANLICTCTNSSVPLFDGALLKAGTHINAIGAYTPKMRELDTQAVQRARVIIDGESAAGREAGDLLIPLSEGAIDPSHIKGTLAELVAGKIVGRTAAPDITLFKSCGLAIEDLVAAQLAYEKAVGANIGTRIHF
jgi:ornithine cyclodeaminase/alanine dehydrogenase-like protein (mu-crystallin family)